MKTVVFIFALLAFAACQGVKPKADAKTGTPATAPTPAPKPAASGDAKKPAAKPATPAKADDKKKPATPAKKDDKKTPAKGDDKKKADDKKKPAAPAKKDDKKKPAAPSNLPVTCGSKVYGTVTYTCMKTTKRDVCLYTAP